MDSQTLVTQMQQLGLWPEEPASRAEIVQLQQRVPDAKALCRELLGRNLITPYQVNQILTGKGQALAVGPYRIDERLGEGASAQIYKAHHTRMQLKVALKIIRPERVRNNPTAVDRFLREAQAAAALSHPNVVRAYDVGQAGDSYYFAMEFIAGVDLARLVEKEGLLPVNRVCDYILQAARGLQHIHEKGMIHRDIKPSNLMVTRLPAGADGTAPTVTFVPNQPDPPAPWGQVKILDLGLARLDEDPTAPNQQTALTKVGTVMGTPDYMAPEQALHSRHADIRSDIYSLGCSFYYALTGRVPFPGGDAIEKMLKHQLDDPQPVETLRPDVPEPVRAIVNKMMAKKKESRYQTPQELVNALQAVVEAPPPRAIPVGPALAGDTNSVSMTLSEMLTPASIPPEPLLVPMTPSPPPAPPEFPFTPPPSAAPEESPFTMDNPVQLPFTPLVRVPSAQSEWGLWVLLGAACALAIICLAVAVKIVLR